MSILPESICPSDAYRNGGPATDRMRCDRRGPYVSISQSATIIGSPGCVSSPGRLRFFGQGPRGGWELPVLGSTTLCSWSTLRFSSVCTMPEGQRITTFLISVAVPIPDRDARIVGRLACCSLLCAGGKSSARRP